MYVRNRAGQRCIFEGHSYEKAHVFEDEFVVGSRSGVSRRSGRALAIPNADTPFSVTEPSAWGTHSALEDHDAKVNQEDHAFSEITGLSQSDAKVHMGAIKPGQQGKLVLFDHPQPRRGFVRGQIAGLYPPKKSIRSQQHSNQTSRTINQGFPVHFRSVLTDMYNWHDLCLACGTVASNADSISQVYIAKHAKDLGPFLTLRLGNAILAEANVKNLTYVVASGSTVDGVLTADLSF